MYRELWEDRRGTSSSGWLGQLGEGGQGYKGDFSLYTLLYFWWLNHINMSYSKDEQENIEIVQRRF